MNPPMKTAAVVVTPRPASWAELAAAGFVGFLLGVMCSYVWGAGTAIAGGPTVVTWDQGADCGLVTGWELLVSPITAAQPNPQPSAAPVGVTIANSGTPPCGLAMTRTVNVAGVGPSRFWLRAVAGPTKSGESNSVDASLPLARPAGLSVAVP